ncbi:hypothetical protein EG68_06143, partial [Paragonimus skrjabini miyazakii]
QIVFKPDFGVSLKTVDAIVDPGSRGSPRFTEYGLAANSNSIRNSHAFPKHLGWGSNADVVLGKAYWKRSVKHDLHMTHSQNILKSHALGIPRTVCVGHFHSVTPM